MATLNGAPFLEQQVESILTQFGSQDELVISDDGSDDGTLEILARFRDSRIRIFHNEFRNPTRNFEFSLRQARGKAVFLSDQDDEWHADKLERMVPSLERYELVVCNCEVVDETGQQLAASYFDLNRSRSGLLANLWRNSYLGCCMGFRRNLLDRALPIPAGVAHDIWLGLVAELVGDTKFLAQPLVRFRRHQGVASYAARRSRRSLYEKLGSRLGLAVQLGLRYPSIKWPSSG